MPPVTQPNPIEKPRLPLIDEETKSLLQLGFIMPLDIIFFGLLLLAGFTSVIWILAARPDFVYIMAILLCLHFLTTIWSVTLIYRACYFVLKMRAVMETMPEIAAQIAFKIHEQRLTAISGAGAGAAQPTPMPSGRTK